MRELCDLVFLNKSIILFFYHTKFECFIEVGAESTIDDRCFRFIREKKHLRLAWVVVFEHIVICARDFDYAITNMLETHFFYRVCVYFLISRL